ncbi:hypothetical protein LEP1GSC170_2435 [Leptospira interrogans serovar Bataviae str. HAI135]|nr:hypothetical protein LEP1GSC170_2435 [Leptospira interrogans serovar Bataviae str. HAI135]
MPFFAFCGIFLGGKFSLPKASFDKIAENKLQINTQVSKNLQPNNIFKKLNLFLDQFIIFKTNKHNLEKENISSHDPQFLNTDTDFDIENKQTNLSNSAVSIFDFSFYKLKKKILQNKISFSNKFVFEKTILY